MTNMHGQAANVDNIRGLPSSFGMDCYYWWWRSYVVLGSYVFCAGGVVGVMAMKEEMDALVKNYAWELVDCSKNVQVIDNLWVLRTKLNTDGLTQGLHFQLVMKGHLQKAALIMMRPSFLWHTMTQYVMCLQLLLWRGCNYASLM